MEHRLLATQIVQVVMTDLHGRKGVGNELDEIDGYIYKDLTDELILKVTRTLDTWPSAER